MICTIYSWYIVQCCLRMSQYIAFLLYQCIVSIFDIIPRRSILLLIFDVHNNIDRVKGTLSTSTSVFCLIAHTLLSVAYVERFDAAVRVRIIMTSSHTGRAAKARALTNVFFRFNVYL